MVEVVGGGLPFGNISRFERSVGGRLLRGGRILRELDGRILSRREDVYLTSQRNSLKVQIVHTFLV